MKRILILGLIMFAGVSFTMNAQSKQQKKQAKKESKELKKEGWDNLPGDPTIEMQLIDNYVNYPKKQWVKGKGSGTGQTQNAARLQAISFAKLEIAGAMESEIRGIVEQSVANQQLNSEEAASVDKVIGASKDLISASLGRVDVIFEAVKSNDKAKTVSTQVIVAYDVENARKKANDVVKKKLEEETDLAQDKLDALLGLN